MGFFSDMRAFAPNKRIGSLLIVVIATVVAVFIFHSKPSPTKDMAARRVILSDTNTETTTNKKDTDGDNLADWEEALWGLSSTNADTDEDGIGDFQEVENRKKAVDEAPAAVLSGTDPANPPSATELAGRILISQFLAAKEAGVPLKEDSIALAGQIALGTTNLERTYPIATINDLTIIPGTMTTKEYGNGIGAALMNTSGTPAPSELYVMLTYIQTPDSEKFQKDMADVIERYDMTIDRFLALGISSDRTDTHLALTNALIAVRTDLVDLSKVGDNPLMAITALDAYQRDSSLMTGLFEKLRASLLHSDATFAPGEPGYVFINATTTQPTP